MIGLSIGGSVTLTLGTSSIFRKDLRCSMLLVIPGLFAGRGRAMMLTLVVGFLIDGPLDSIQNNLEKLIDSFVCLYKQGKTVVCEAREAKLQQTRQVSVSFYIRHNKQWLSISDCHQFFTIKFFTIEFRNIEFYWLFAITIVIQCCKFQ